MTAKRTNTREFTPGEWTVLRHCARSGQSSFDAERLLKYEFSASTIRSRCTAAGVRFTSRSAHHGTSKLYLGTKEEEKRFAKQETA